MNLFTSMQRVYKTLSIGYGTAVNESIGSFIKRTSEFVKMATTI